MNVRQTNGLETSPLKALILKHNKYQDVFSTLLQNDTYFPVASMILIKLTNKPS